MRSSPPPEDLSPTRSALLASGAPPSPFGTALGFSSSCRTRETEVPREPLLEFDSSSELFRVVSARFPFSGPARLREPARSREFGSASPGVPAPANTTTSGAPFHRCDRSRPPRWTRVAATPSSVPSSGFLPLSTVPAALAALHGPLARSAVTPWRPDALRPCFMPLASLWSCPSELSLPEEPYPLSRAYCFPASSQPTAASAAMAGTFTIAFPLAVALCLRSTRGRTETHEPRRWFPAVAETASLNARECAPV